MAEPLDTDLLAAGVACTQLIANPTTWINRRVETIELLSHEETRRRVSIDFSLAEQHRKDLATADGLIVPISLLTKEPRRHFDLRDESGRAVPVLGKRQNSAVAHVALMNGVVAAVPDLKADDFEALVADLRPVAFAEKGEAAEAFGSFVDKAEAGDRLAALILKDADCRSLLEALWQQYVLCAVLTPGDWKRRILKYSYGDDFVPARARIRERLPITEVARTVWHPDRRPFVVECPGAWRAKSFHVEVAVPEELRVRRAVLYDFISGEELSDTETDVNRASLYATRGSGGTSDVGAYVEVGPERIGRTFQAAWTSSTIAALLWLGVASGLRSTNPGSAVSILLAGAALFAGVVVVQGEHILVRQVFAAARRWLVIATLAALAGSASLAMELPDQHPVAVWRVVAVIATVAAARLVWSAVRAPA